MSFPGPCTSLVTSPQPAFVEGQLPYMNVEESNSHVYQVRLAVPVDFLVLDSGMTGPSTVSYRARTTELGSLPC